MNRTIRCGIACLILGLALGLAACGDSGDENAIGVDPESELTLKQAQAPLPDGAPPELVSLRDDANQLIEDDASNALQQRLDDLKAAGIPVVINKWASWCGPCRQEFPDFQKEAIEHGDEVAFIGLNSNDGPDTGNTFLSEFPVPYPTYSDPDQDISRDLKADFGFPNTLFIDSSGEPVHDQPGPFESADALSQTIDEYAQ